MTFYRDTLIRRRERVVHTWPLNRYLASYKVQHTHCAQCGESLKRTFLAFNGQPLPLRAIKLLTVRVDAATWRTYRAGLQALCRSCSQLLDARDSPYFDLLGFKRHLSVNSDLKARSIHEYIVRLRRLADMAASWGIAAHMPHTLDTIAQGITAYVPLTQQASLAVALRQYQYFADAIGWGSKQPTAPVSWGHNIKGG